MRLELELFNDDTGHVESLFFNVGFGTEYTGRFGQWFVVGNVTEGGAIATCLDGDADNEEYVGLEQIWRYLKPVGIETQTPDRISWFEPLPGVRYGLIGQYVFTIRMTPGRFTYELLMETGDRVIQRKCGLRSIEAIKRRAQQWAAELITA